MQADNPACMCEILLFLPIPLKEHFRDFLQHYIVLSLTDTSTSLE
jgi:hypothetical protein